MASPAPRDNPLPLLCSIAVALGLSFGLLCAGATLPGLRADPAWAAAVLFGPLCVGFILALDALLPEARS